MTNLASYLHLLHAGQLALAAAFANVAGAHQDEPDIQVECEMFAEQASHQAQQLAPLVHGGATESPSTRFGGPRTGGLGLLRDLHDLSLMATECEISWTAIGQAARGLRDEGLVAVVEHGDAEIKGQIAWLRTRMKQSAPQALVVAG